MIGKNKFQETAEVISRKTVSAKELVEYRCPCGNGKIISQAAWGFNDYVAWIECDDCRQKFIIVCGHGRLWELKEKD